MYTQKHPVASWYLRCALNEATNKSFVLCSGITLDAKARVSGIAVILKESRRGSVIELVLSARNSPKTVSSAKIIVKAESFA